MPIQAVISSTRIPAKLWIPIEEVESSAIDQIKNVANLPITFSHLAIMPDCHTGYGATVGSVIATTDTIIPSAVGVDIGCGMLAVRLPLDPDQVKANLPAIKHSIERSIPTGFHENRDMTLGAEKKWDILEGHPGDPDPFNRDTELKSLQNKAQHQLGSLGGGNHFIEISLDQEGKVWILLHSGSRYIGLKVADHYINKAKELMKRWHIGLPDPYLAYLPTEEQVGKDYLADAQWAQSYASANRLEMLERVLKDLAYLLNEGKPIEVNMKDVINCHHNYVERENHFGKNVWVTRKGAIRVRLDEMAIIPGSMGTASYIVKGLGEPQSFCSASHGAGRKMSRKEAKRQFNLDDFKKQTEGILCTQDASAIDEIPGAYKDINTVMERQSDLVKPMFKLHQLMCIKGGE